MMTNLAYHKTDPGELLDADERASWDRLGPRHFWLWAMTGYTAEARAEDDIP